MLTKPAVMFPDVVEWAVGYLRTELAARPSGETYADDVTVGRQVPKVVPKRLITVRDDGGQRGPVVTKTASLGVRVFAEKWEVAADLARLVAALFEQAPGSGSVVAHIATSGPYPVGDESEKPQFYMSVDLSVRGSSL